MPDTTYLKRGRQGNPQSDGTKSGRGASESPSGGCPFSSAKKEAKVTRVFGWEDYPTDEISIQQKQKEGHSLNARKDGKTGRAQVGWGGVGGGGGGGGFWVGWWVVGWGGGGGCGGGGWGGGGGGGLGCGGGGGGVGGVWGGFGVGGGFGGGQENIKVESNFITFEGMPGF